MSGQPGWGPRSPLEVIVVDPRPVLRQALAALLGDADGIEVAGLAASGEEATSLNGDLQPDVAVVCAWGWPGAPAAVRLLSRCEPAPAIVVLADGDRTSLLAAVRAGATACLGPQAGADDLRGAIEAVLRGEHVLPPTLTAELMRAYASGRADDEDPDSVRLTRREQDVVALMAHGRTDDEVAATLGVSRRTVQRALAEARRATGLRARSELARWVAEQPFFKDRPRA